MIAEKEILRGLMEISDEVMWRATVDCDKEFDGRFFYAVKTVGVYCRPSCKSKTPLRKNVSFFETRENAESAGFRPCKRCRPDLSVYAPVLETAARIKEAIDCYFSDKEQLRGQMQGLGVTLNHASVIFKRQYGITPTAYADNLRQNLAMDLLKTNGLKVIDIAAESGFNSISAFNAFFKKRTGLTPGEYRALHRGTEPHKGTE